MDKSGFTPALLKWFAANGRELPWRGIGDAYGIWVSEIILQQTRIDQGTEYWLRFMERFPTVVLFPRAGPSSPHDAVPTRDRTFPKSRRRS